ncbi:unnamed protein product [Triticum turgidum subsp. durum]|uniref:Uncharacterized protein n=1 Tax=Triticum turgidum subsp. durum TaxID=4567 RepID=A0A9R1Q8R3_TRITD|nr:unnamed protein product [Triticum turgidum subsp. durum]
MVSAPENTSSTHRSALVGGTHQFQIVGYGVRKVSSPIRSGDFHAGGHTWALACEFGDQGDGHLASITLQMVGNSKANVVAMVSLRIDDPRGRWPAALWRSDDPNVFSKTGNSWKLTVPNSFREHEARYVENDRLTILCAVDVLKEEIATTLKNKDRSVSVVPSSPTVSQDLAKLMPTDAEMTPGCVPPDVTFVVEQSEIKAHKLVLAVRSPVLIAELDLHSATTTVGPCVVRIDDMSVSTFKAMLRFIYTDEMPIKPNSNDMPRPRRACKEKYASRRRETMARDLLVAADRYGLERLRLMCEKILTESLNVATVMSTLLLVRGRHSCRQLEESCIEYIASHPDVYAAVKGTEGYQKLKENSSSSIILEVMDRVAMHSLDRNRSSSDGINCPRPADKSCSTSTYYVSEVACGAHEFKIPNFKAVQRSHGLGQPIYSGIFKVGGHDWKIRLYPSGNATVVEQDDEYISVFLELVSDPPPVQTAGVKTAMCFKIQDPSRPSSPFKEPYTASRTSTTRVGVTVIVPPSQISTQLEQLLASENGSDVSFLVEANEIRAHRLVIAARAPALHEAAAVATKNKEEDHAAAVVRVDDMKAAVFKAVLHFIYTDELLPGDSTRLLAGDMLTAACRFGLTRMKAMCENLLCESLTKDNVLATVKLARHHHCKGLEDYCIEFVSTPDVAKELLKTFIGLQD